MTSTIYGGQLLHVVVHRANKTMFSVKVTNGNTQTEKTAIVSFMNKHNAVALALALEHHNKATGEFPTPVQQKL